MTKIHNIAKNTSYLTLALIGQKIISFAYFAILARNLAPAALGQYYFAISFTTIFAIFIDLGIVNVLTREIAKNNSKANSWLGNVITLKTGLALLSVAAAFIIAQALGYDPVVKQLVYLSAICMVLDSFTTTFFAVIRGFHSLIFESIAAIGFQIIVMAVGLWALFSGLSLNYLMLALVLASGVNFVYSTLILRFRFKIALAFLYDSKLVRTIIGITAPFALFAIFQRLYTYLDSVLLLSLADERAVGLYQVAFKIIFALQFLPMAFTASLYPAMSHYWVHDRQQLAISFKRALNYLLIISVPISAGVAVLADKIILIFKADYLEAILPLQITILALLFIFINFPIGSLLNACDRQRVNTRNMVVVTVISIILNVILIPQWQAVGASITVLVTHFLMFLLGVRWVKKIIDYSPRTNLIVFFKALLSALFMVVFILTFKASLNIFLVIIAAGLIYFTLLFLLGGFSRHDLESIKKSFSKS